MNCSKCDYPLWNLAPGSCPECGESFDPTGHEFVVGRVRFCCPECDQTYYGDGANGHLQPHEFDCVSCGRHITERECVVRPLDGEDEIASTVVPWYQEHLGFFSRFFRTCGWAMVRPIELGKGTPLTASTAAAVGFMSLIQLLGVVVGGFPLMVLVMGVPMLGGGGGGGAMAAAFPLLVVASVGVLGTVAFILLNACVAHLILVFTGRLQHGLGRTVTLCCLGSGSGIIVAIPCFGPYCGSYVSGIWVVVSTILVLIHGQRVSGWRAGIAVLSLPFAALVLGVAAILFVQLAAVNTLARAPMPPTPKVLAPAAARPAVELQAEEVAAALRDFTAIPFQNSPDLFLGEVDRLVPGLLQAGGPVTMQIDGNGFVGWWNREMMLLAVPGVGGILVTQTTDAPEGRRFLVIEVQGMIESTKKVDEESLHLDLVRRLDSLGARGLDLTESMIRNWFDSSES